VVDRLSKNPIIKSRKSVHWESRRSHADRHMTTPVACFSQICTVLKSKYMYGYFSGLCSEIGDCGRPVLNIVVVSVVWSTLSVGGECATLWMGALSGFDSW